jgi:hypothetical protein
MPGGLLQLLALGNQNLYLTGNPSITFFKKVYNTYTNFSMESIRIDLNRNDVFVNENTILKATIDRHGDMVSQVYFVFELPDIDFSDELLFKWVDFVGETIVDNYHISINGNIIDKQTGEFAHLYQSLSFDAGKKYMYEKLVGQRFDIPSREIPSTPYGMYVQSFDPTNVPARKIYLPLHFWFNKSLAHSLPLISLQYSEVELTIELRPLKDIYRLYYVKNGVSDFYAPNLNDSTHALSAFIDNTNKRYQISENLIDIKAYLEVNYIYLDKSERAFFLYKPIEYLIEQTSRIERSGLAGSSTIDLVLQNPVKEILWVCSRSDRSLKNDWFNYHDNNATIMENAKLIFNGIDRFDLKDSIYFNYVQPYQHHRCNYKDGLYVYSFAINADDIEQPSGACNMSMINKIQMYMTLRRPTDISYQYDTTFYVVNYNLFRIEKGLGSLAFSK